MQYPTTMLIVAVAASPVKSTLVSVIGGGVLICRASLALLAARSPEAVRCNRIWMSVYGIYLAPLIIIGFATILVLLKGTTILVPPKGSGPNGVLLTLSSTLRPSSPLRCSSRRTSAASPTSPDIRQHFRCRPSSLTAPAPNFMNRLPPGAPAVVVGEPFLGVTFRVRRPPYDADWVATIINTQQPRWIASERLPQQKSLNEEGLSNRDTVRDAGAVHRK